MAFPTIMVRVDVEPSNDAGLRIAIDLAGQFNAKLIGIAAAPSPGDEGGVAGHVGSDAERGGRQQRAAWRAALCPGRVEAAPLGGAMLHREQHGAGPFAAEHDALHEAQQDEQDRRQHADLTVRRQQTDQRRRRAHGTDRRNQHRTASDDVAKAAANDAADWPRHHADAVGQER